MKLYDVRYKNLMLDKNLYINMVGAGNSAALA